jgi:hypothetical protein
MRDSGSTQPAALGQHWFIQRLAFHRVVCLFGLFFGSQCLQHFPFDRVGFRFELMFGCGYEIHL